MCSEAFLETVRSNMLNGLSIYVLFFETRLLLKRFKNSVSCFGGAVKATLGTHIDTYGNSSDPQLPD